MQSISRQSMWSTALLCVTVLIGFVSLTFQTSTPNDTFYIAGVVEFEPAASNQTSLDQINDNVRGYLELMRSSEATTTDIIIFPELTLNNVIHMTYVPDPNDNIIPCNNSEYEPFFQELSCAVRNVKKYVVINLLEKENCTSQSQASKNDPRPCALNGLSSFNTNVVFNRDGMVISRYRKYNVYNEPRNVTYLPELSTFDTDFGVKFGLFICFDINFHSPAMDLVKLGITDMIYNAFWYSELPFLTAVQLQQSWAYANEVNLLASGASYPLVGSTGSGIYAGKRGALVSVMARSAERKIYIANVTKSTHWAMIKPDASKKAVKPMKRSLNGLKLMREYRMEAFTSQHLDLVFDTEVKKQLCHDSFCCNFSLKMKKLSPPDGTLSYQYHLAVFDGDRNYSGNGYTKYRLCAVYACTNQTSESCGTVFEDSVDISPDFIFESISITGDFPKVKKVLIMPNSLDQDLNPLTVDRFEFDITDGKNSHHVKHKLLKASDDLLTFGIYANYYDGKSTSSLISSSTLTVFFGALFVLIAVKVSYI